MNIRYKKYLIGLFLLIVTASHASADVLGDSRTLFISSTYDARQRSSVHATVQYVSDKAYFYIDDAYWNSTNDQVHNAILSDLRAVGTEFDARIYPVETKFWGSEPNPGIDGDPRITIYIGQLVQAAGGYYDTTNEVPLSEAPNSNVREIIYLNINSLPDHRKIESFLSHEFQHLIAFNQKENTRRVSDDVWFNEFRSEYSVGMLGYDDPYMNSNLERRVSSFLQDPSDSLTEWQNTAADYGSITLFGEYLAGHIPSKVLADAEHSDQIGITSLNQALEKNGVHETFASLFEGWLAANILNDTRSNLKFGYTNPGLLGLHVEPTKTFTNLGDEVLFSVMGDFKDWQPRWYDVVNFAPGNNRILQVKFSSPSLTSFSIAYLVVKKDGSTTLSRFNPTSDNPVLYIDGIGNDVGRVILMPYKKDKISGFGANEPTVSLTTNIDRIASASPTTSLSMQPTSSNVASSSMSLQIFHSVKPSDFGLHEGDFIRATNDIDIYIVNDYGYKRLVLSPAICLQYGHLGARGCFSAVKEVTPQVRDAFKTSPYYSNGETNDGKVYRLILTGPDSAYLQLDATTKNDFMLRGMDINQIFKINTKEQNSYTIKI